MKLHLKLHFIGVAIFIFWGAFKMARAESGYEVLLKIGLGAFVVGLVMKLYDDYLDIQMRKKD